MRHILLTSGGKDSTALAIWMKANRPDVPVEYVFCDTGRELPELYSFLAGLESVLGQPIRRLVDGWHCETCDVAGTDPEMAACPTCGGRVRPRDMDYYMERWGNEEDGPYLPSAGARWCTKHLKIRPLERYLRGSEAIVYIAFRADEDRVGNYGDKAGIAYAYPFQEAGVNLPDVLAILHKAGVALPDFYKWRGVGGCWNCPFQKAKHWLGLSRNHPHLFARAVAEEERSAFTYSGSGNRLPLLIIRAEAKEAQGTLWAEEDDLDGACSICAK